MKISIDKIDRGASDTLVFVRMSRYEAIRTIESLAAQLGHHDSNVGRYETVGDDRIEFSIAVVEEPGEK